MPVISTQRCRCDNKTVPAYGPTYVEVVSETLVQARHQAYVDSPEYLPIEWIKACGGLDAPLAEFPEKVKATFRPLIIGAGWAGTRMALDFAKCGIKAHIIEALDHCGGRTSAVHVNTTNEYPLGSMRYPPSEGMLFEWTYHFGFGMLKPFVDPGFYPTLLTFSNLMLYWNDPTVIPKGFETVYKGWNTMLEQGFEIDGEHFASFAQIAELLRSPNLEDRKLARPHWQKYIDRFEHVALRDIMMAIFVNNGKPPGGVRWTLNDLDETWSKGGIGSGGFGVFFSLCALSVMRDLPNEWEVDQCSFAEKQLDGKWKPTSVQKLVETMLNKAKELVGLEVEYETELVNIHKRNVRYGSPIYTVTVQKSDGTGRREIECDLPILAIPPKVIVELGLARDDLFPSHISKALKNVHMVQTTKVFGSLLRDYFDNPNEVRVILGDVFQTYILDFNDPKYMVGLLDYAWEENSSRYKGETDPKKCVAIVKEDITKALENSKYAYWLRHLNTIEDAFVIHWEDFKYARGGFVLLKPDQDKYASELSHYSGADGPCVTTASATPNDGWIEGAEIKEHHDFAHIADRYGVVFHRDISPVVRMVPFNYGKGKMISESTRSKQEKSKRQDNDLFGADTGRSGKRTRSSAS